MPTSPLTGPVMFPPNIGSLTVMFERERLPVFVTLKVYLISSPILAEAGPSLAILMPGSELSKVTNASESAVSVAPSDSPVTEATFLLG